MQLQIDAEYAGAYQRFILDVGPSFGNPGSNDIIEEAAARVFGVPFEDHEFVNLIDVVEKSDGKH